MIIYTCLEISLRPDPFDQPLKIDRIDQHVVVGEEEESLSGVYDRTNVHDEMQPGNQFGSIVEIRIDELMLNDILVFGMLLHDFRLIFVRKLIPTGHPTSRFQPEKEHHLNGESVRRKAGQMVRMRCP